VCEWAGEWGENRGIEIEMERKARQLVESK